MKLLAKISILQKYAIEKHIFVLLWKYLSSVQLQRRCQKAASYFYTYTVEQEGRRVRAGRARNSRYKLKHETFKLWFRESPLHLRALEQQVAQRNCIFSIFRDFSRHDWFKSGATVSYHMADPALSRCLDQMNCQHPFQTGFFHVLKILHSSFSCLNIHNPFKSVLSQIIKKYTTQSVYAQELKTEWI